MNFWNKKPHLYNRARIRSRDAHQELDIAGDQRNHGGGNDGQEGEEQALGEERVAAGVAEEQPLGWRKNNE